MINIITYSFLSEHIWNAFAPATILAAYFKYAVPLLVLAAFVRFIRMYLFVHCPTDIVARAATGVLTAMFVLYMVKRHPSLMCRTDTSHDGGKGPGPAA